MHQIRNQPKDSTLEALLNQILGRIQATLRACMTHWRSKVASTQGSIGCNSLRTRKQWLALSWCPMHFKSPLINLMRQTELISRSDQAVPSCSIIKSTMPCNNSSSISKASALSSTKTQSPRLRVPRRNLKVWKGPESRLNHQWSSRNIQTLIQMAVQATIIIM